MKTPEEARADMAKQVLGQMLMSGDPLMAENAKIAIDLQNPGQQAPAPATQPATAPAPVVQHQPAQAPVVPTTQVPAQPAVPWDKEIHGLGKYNSREELEKGYFNAVNQLSKTADELANLRSQTSAGNSGQPAATVPGAFIPGSTPGSDPRVNPTVHGVDPAIDEFVKASEESGVIDPVKLGQVIAKVASRAASETVKGELAPLQAMQQAETYMATNYPESGKHAQEVANFVKTDPVVGATFASLMKAGQVTGAFEYAWQMYTVKAGIGTERAMVANSQIAEEERQRARAAAGFASSPNTGVHTPVKDANEPVSAERVAQLNATADIDQGLTRRRELLGRFLPAEWRTWEQGR